MPNAARHWPIAKEMLKRVGTLVASSVQMICLPALNDEGVPIFNKNDAAAFAVIRIPAFACIPDSFPDLMTDCRDSSARHQPLGVSTEHHDIAGERMKQAVRSACVSDIVSENSVAQVSPGEKQVSHARGWTVWSSSCFKAG